ncbi:MAG TPA: hypothetical protein VGL19_08685 [Polyangiaceae bacterium]
MTASVQKPTSCAGLLVVVELGADWPSRVHGELCLLTRTGARRVLAQRDSESPTAFAQRVSEQLDGLFARGVTLGNSVVSCNERLDDCATRARFELCRAAASAMARGAGGRLRVSACDRNQGRSRAAFATLESELRLEWQSAGVELDLHFVGDVAEPAVVTQVARKADAKPRRARGPAPGKAGTRRVA